MICVLCGYRDTIDGLPNPETHSAYLRKHNGWCRSAIDGHHRRTNNHLSESGMDKCAVCSRPLRATRARD